MEFKKINLVDLNPATYNPRKISETAFQELSESIDKFGFVDPIIVNLKNNVIIGGHQRYDVLMDKYMRKEIGNELCLVELGEVGWCFPESELNITDEDEMDLCVQLNVQSGEWDNEKLKQLFDELSVKGFDVNLTGFSDDEIKVTSSFMTDDEIDDLFDDGNSNEESEEEVEETKTNASDFDRLLFKEDVIDYMLQFQTSEDEFIWSKFLRYVEKKDTSQRILALKVLEVFEHYV